MLAGLTLAFFPYSPECVEKKNNSRKFKVASVPPSSAASAPERLGGTVLGSKRTYQVAFVAPLCIKGLRLVTLQLPEKFSPKRAAATRLALEHGLL
jgi:hypothetical protein